MSDVAPYESKGPFRDKSLEVAHGSSCDGPSAETDLCPRSVSGKSLGSFGRGSNGTGSSDKSWSLSIRVMSPARRLSIDPGPPSGETRFPRAAQDLPRVRESSATSPGRAITYPETVYRSETSQVFRESTSPGSVQETPAQRRLPMARRAPLAPDIVITPI